jgi:hypothetical protein
MDSLVTRHINRVNTQERQAAKHFPKKFKFPNFPIQNHKVYYQPWGYNPRGWVGGEW